MATKGTCQCLQKAGHQEELFVLRAQDLTADLVVECWSRIQGLVREQRKLNKSDADIRAEIRRRMLGAFLVPGYQTSREEEAMAVALRMQAHQPRKWAD